MRTVVLVLALVLVAGCSKSPTEPTITDRYSPMYGTWTGLIMASSDGFSWAVTDSVRLLISPAGASPGMHLWQLKVESAPGYPTYPNSIWREIPFTPTQVVGGLVPIKDWDGSITGDCAPDTATDAVHGLLGWNRPACVWGGSFQPLAPRSGRVTGLQAYWHWSGIEDSIGTTYLVRR